MPNVIISPTGVQGPRGNSVLNGIGAPTGSVGTDGDWYIDTAATKLYGPKAAGVWPSTGIPMSASAAGALLAANNLSDVGNAATARTNLGLGGAATLNVGTTAGTVAAGNDSRITGAIQTGAAAGGDLTGALPNPTVAKVNGVTVAGTPSAGQVPTATSGTAATWQALPSASTSTSGVVQLDGTAGDIAALGTQAAGSTGKAADAGHVHPMPRLDQVGAPTAAVGMNSQKLTNLANGTAATDAAAFGQVVPAAGGTFTGDVAFNGHLTQNGFYLPMTFPTGRRPAWRAATWSQLFQSGHGWTAGGGGTSTSNVNDTSTFVRGTQSVTVTTTGTGVQSYVRKTGMPSFDMTGKMLRIVFKVDDVTNLGTMALYVGSSSLANYLTWNPFHTKSATGSPDLVQSGEWVTITLSWADIKSAAGTYSISASGVPSTTTGFTDMSFAVYDNGSGPVTYHLQSIELVPDTTTTFPNGVVSLVWDDSFQNVYDNGRPLMDTYGFRGTMYNIAGAIGTGGSLTLAEMRSLQNFSGWEMGGHAYSTTNHNLGYNQLTAQQVSDDLRNLRAWMVSNGFTSEHFAYPHGQFGLTTDGAPIDQIASQYFTTARGINSETIESFGPCMPYRLRSLTGLNDGSGLGGATVSQVTAAGGLLDRCQLNGDWLIITLHQIVSGTPTDSTQISQTGFSTLLAAINSRGIPVVPVGDMMRYYS